ncbi:sodium-dependent glucose transporter 1B-like isoform X1 [Ornithodoros turicata]|uniref:sodium-dependent glucose transporter 1B-like isoform X1 n=2 Tax=Ornithodoros turicata TaxID=34597 RepID=UPI003139F920
MSPKKPLVLALAHTTALNMGCAGLACIMSLTGVALLDLHELYDASIGAVSHLMTSRSVGTLVGSLVGGHLFETCNKQLVITLTVALMSGTFVFLPLSVNLYLAYLASFLNGVGVGGFDTGALVLLIKLWPDNPGPAQHIYHFCFGVGSLLAPLLAQPFLSVDAHDSDPNATSNHSLFSTSPTVDDFPVSSRSSATTPESRIHYAFLIVTIYLAAVVVFLAVLYIVDKSKNYDTVVRQTKDTEAVQSSAASDVRFSRILIGLAGVYIAAYVTMECAYGHMLTTFGVKSDLHMPKSTAVYLTEFFFATFTAAGVLAALVAMKVSPFGLLLASKVTLLFAFCVLSVWGAKSSVVLWVGTALSGLGQAVIYGGVVSFCADYMEVTSNMMSVIVFTDGFGAMLAPVLVGPFIERFPMVLMYLCLALAIAMSIIFIVLHLLTRKRNKLKGSSETENANDAVEVKSND